MLAMLRRGGTRVRFCSGRLALCGVKNGSNGNLRHERADMDSGSLSADSIFNLDHFKFSLVLILVGELDTRFTARCLACRV